MCLAVPWRCLRRNDRPPKGRSLPWFEPHDKRANGIALASPASTTPRILALVD